MPGLGAHSLVFPDSQQRRVGFEKRRRQPRIGMTLNFFVRTYGCQMNERDSENLSCLLQAQGMLPVDSENDADVLIFNTCSVRDQAERKAIGKIGLMKRLKKQREHLVIAVIGCMAQSRGATLLQDLPHVDIVLGTDQLHQLPARISDVVAQRRQVVATDFSAEIADLAPRHRAGQVCAQVAVMRGCNQFCTYCIVPYVRGREKSRSIAEIVSEIEALAAQGSKEVLLLGQNITAYGMAEAASRGVDDETFSPFAELLQAVNAISGLERIRFTSPHPKYMNAAFVEALATLPKVCEAFHIPLQSGSDRILAAMKRGYSIADYRRRIAQISQRLPQATFSTDIIVGFPGETEADFAATRAVMDEVGFDMAYIFKYSRRQGTRAAALCDDQPMPVKEQRNQVLLADLAERALRNNQAFIGQRLQVLVEGASKRNASRWSGRARNNKTCLFTPAATTAIGDLVEIKVTRVTATSLFGDLLF